MWKFQIQPQRNQRQRLAASPTDNHEAHQPDVREIKMILREYKPEIMFLCETKLMGQLIKGKAAALNFQNCFAISSSGKGGGLAMMWNENVAVEIKSYNKHHIDVVVQSNESSYWRCTGVYGNPKAEERKHTWELIRRLSGLSSLP